MRIVELLGSKGSSVVTVSPEATVADVLGALAHHNIGAIVVSRDGHTIDGIVSERDIVRALDANGAPVLTRAASSIMSHDVHTAAPSDAVDSVMATMTNRRIRHVPVVDGGEMIGIVSIGDVVKSRTDELERDRELLVDYIGAR
jgi:CBS domain-containing protein